MLSFVIPILLRQKHRQDGSNAENLVQRIHADSMVQKDKMGWNIRNPRKPKLYVAMDDTSSTLLLQVKRGK